MDPSSVSVTGLTAGDKDQFSSHITRLEAMLDALSASSKTRLGISPSKEEESQPSSFISVTVSAFLGAPVNFPSSTGLDDPKFKPTVYQDPSVSSARLI